MIDLNLLNSFRINSQSVVELYGWAGDGTCGAFEMPSPIDGATLVIIASTGEGWDHVSISRKNRAPNQRELDHVFRMFFKVDEAAVQYFVPRTEHVNNMPNCLHLWRPHSVQLPKPPIAFV